MNKPTFCNSPAWPCDECKKPGHYYLTDGMGYYRSICDEHDPRPLYQLLLKYRKTLLDIQHCCGYCPEHLGANNYDDPGIVLAKEIIAALRREAGKALE